MKLLLLALLGALVAFSLAAEPAGAKTTGPCTIMIAGADVSQVDKVSVKPGDSVAYAFSAPSAIASYEVQLLFGPYEATPSSGEVESEETSISGTAAIEEYTWLGVGLYELRGSVVLANGETCAGTIQVEVEGNPLATVAGGSAAAVAGLSTLALIGLFLKDAGWLFAAA